MGGERHDINALTFMILDSTLHLSEFLNHRMSISSWLSFNSDRAAANDINHKGGVRCKVFIIKGVPGGGGGGGEGGPWPPPPPLRD